MMIYTVRETEARRTKSGGLVSGDSFDTYTTWEIKRAREYAAHAAKFSGARYDIVIVGHEVEEEGPAATVWRDFVLNSCEMPDPDFYEVIVEH